MTTTTDRPLPVDLGTLNRHWLPDPPTDGDVARYKAAIGRIDALIAPVVELVARLADADRQALAELVDAAVAGDPLDARFPLGERHQVDHELDQLRNARALAVARLTRAEYDDPVHLAWLARCRAITAEWQAAANGETAEARFDGLCRFAERHRPELT